MNCKPGDIAITVPTSSIHLAGKFCEVISCVVGRCLAPDGGWWESPNGSWLVKYQHPELDGGRIHEYALWLDSSLLPIRPGDLHETEDDLNEVSA